MTSSEVLPPEESQPHPALEALREAVHKGFPRAVADLSQLVRIPSVSWDGFDASYLATSASAVHALFEELGVFDSVEISSAPIGKTTVHGQPAVLATRAAR